MTTATSDVSTRLGALEAWRKDAKADRDALLDMVGKTYTAVETLTAKVDVHEIRLAAIETDVGQLKQDVGVLKQDVGVLKQDVGVLKQDVGVLKQEIGGLTSAVGVLREDVGVLRDDVGVLSGGMGWHRRALTALLAHSGIDLDAEPTSAPGAGESAGV